MKRIYNLLLTVTALLAFAPAVSAQDWSINGQIKDPHDNTTTLTWPNANVNSLQETETFAYRKDISAPQSDGTYWIKLESFATGMSSYVKAAAPADIVLVLDNSSSMSNNRGNVTDYFLEPTPNNSASTGNSSKWRYRDTDYSNIYYLYDGVRCQVSAYRYRTSNSQPYYYSLRFQDGNGNYHYMLGETVYDSWADVPKSADNDGQDDALWTGSLLHYRRAQRIDALREAVKAFIDVIDHNDKYDEDGELRKDANGQPKRLGNRISIVTYAGAGFVTVQNTLQNEMNDNTAADLKAKVDKFRLNSGTRTALGIDQANNQFELYVDAARMQAASRTVVVFTDGEPYGETRDAAIVSALTSKKADDPETSTKEGYGATVFTVGMFSSTPTEGGDTWRYMHRISSNAPNATSNDNNDTAAGANFNPDAGYYKDASNENIDLTKVFTEIAHQSGGSETQLGIASSNVDVISSSFVLPSDVNASNVDGKVKIFIAKVKENKNEGKVNGVYQFETEYLKGHTPDTWTYFTLDANGNPVGNAKKVDASVSVSLDPNDSKKIKVTGFDYKSCFVGPVYEENYTPTGTSADASHILRYQGYKIIIMIPIKMNPDAVGGPNCDTNGAGSGIYVSDGETTAVVTFKSPKVSLPVNIWITKKGLQGGESAKFMIERAILPDGDNVDASQLTGWEYVSTVFVTKRKGSTTDPVVKVKGLPANMDVPVTQVVNGETVPVYEEDGVTPKTEQKNLVYRISEEDWSWSYTRNTGPKYTNTQNINNPFDFTNTKRDNIEYLIRHAESKATNIFKDLGENGKNEVYDDSKENDRTKTTTTTTEP